MTRPRESIHQVSLLFPTSHSFYFSFLSSFLLHSLSPNSPLETVSVRYSLFCDVIKRELVVIFAQISIMFELRDCMTHCCTCLSVFYSVGIYLSTFRGYLTVPYLRVLEGWADTLYRNVGSRFVKSQKSEELTPSRMTVIPRSFGKYVFKVEQQ